ncbi:MAG: winged helix-turn-helix transcriptional regulator [Chloroflexota bacterium]
MESSSETTRELALLERIENNPDVTQASLATQLDVAIGTVNWHLKRLIEKGYIKIKRAERKKLRYIITPEGIALRARLTMDYIEQQFLLYRRTRQSVREHLERIQAAGIKEVVIHGEGDVADVCRLSCLEEGIALTTNSHAPVLEVVGLKVLLNLDGSHE